MHRDRATEYARAVVGGQIKAGNPHILACKRHLNDLEESLINSNYPYVWNPELSERIINYAETLTIIEGQAPRQVKLFECQTFDIGVPFGWLTKEGFI